MTCSSNSLQTTTDDVRPSDRDAVDFCKYKDSFTDLMIRRKPPFGYNSFILRLRISTDLEYSLTGFGQHLSPPVPLPPSGSSLNGYDREITLLIQALPAPGERRRR